MSPASLLSIWACTRPASVLLAVVLLVTSSEWGAAQVSNETSRADEPTRTANAGSIDFSIPSQQLDSALKVFAAVAQVELFYETDAIAEHRSFAVHGRFLPETAMQVMLQGTGLSSTSLDRGTITILPPTSKGREPEELTRVKRRVVEFAPYLALVQSNLDRAMCRVSVAADDPDEVLARVWISTAGGVQRADLLSTTGSERRDRAYLTVLASVATGERPPATMPQPVNLLLMPRKTQRSGMCLPSLRPLLGSAAHE